MGDTVHLTRDFETNGVVLPAGIVTLDDVRSNMHTTTSTGKQRELTTDEAQSVIGDLQARQASYDKYREGITEKRDYMSRAGSISMGSGE